MFDLNFSIDAWVTHVKDQVQLSASDRHLLEEQVRQKTTELTKQGLSDEEAFLIAIKRVSLEYGYTLIHDETVIWKQVSIKPLDKPTDPSRLKSVLMVVFFSLIAGTLTKLPSWIWLDNKGFAYGLMMFKNSSLFILPLVALYLLIQHKASRKMLVTILGIFAITIFLINIYPYTGQRHTEILSGLHVPFLMWLMIGVTYLGSEWKNPKRRMDFIRFSGEAFIYGVLIFCGLIVLSLFIILIFSSIQVDVSSFITDYLIVYGSCAVILVTVYQVEKKNLMENFAPILARIFSPLFLISMVLFLLTILITGRNPLVDRNYLIAFDGMLVLVLALVLYVISARKEDEKIRLYDYLNIGLISAALIIDGIALVEIVIRLSTMGVTPNKIAALGENIVVLINLAGLIFAYFKIIKNKGTFEQLERFQTSYLNVYAGWFAFVVFVFPLLFGFN